MKRKAAFLLALLIVAVFSLSCAVKIERTFGPIALKAANLHFHQNNVYKLKGMLGFEPYTFEITYDESGTCWIDEYFRLHAGLYANDTYLLGIKVRDAKGNEGVNEYIVDRLWISGPDTIDMSLGTYFQYFLVNAAEDRSGSIKTHWVITGNTYNAYWWYSGYNWNYPVWGNFDYIYDQYCNHSNSFSINTVVYDVNAGSSVTKTINFIP